MAKYRFTKKALNDLIKIWDYTVAEWSQNQAENLIETLIQQMFKALTNLKVTKSNEYQLISIEMAGIFTYEGITLKC